ncbi:MAG: hypothetical protein PHW29_00455 [Flavobacterium sp.]|nr:hypothetical protein [Flavobacterium sp.]
MGIGKTDQLFFIYENIKVIDKEEYNKLRQDAWNEALHSFGYGYIYTLRGGSLSKKLNLITFLGIVIPLLIGAIVTTYGVNSPLLFYMLWVAGPLSILQLVISVWAVVNNWNSSFAYYLETSLDNYKLANDYEEIGKYPDKTVIGLKTQLEKINVLRDNRDKQDNRYPLKDFEKRKGMRYALRKYKRDCAGCNIKPVNMKSSDCGVCGNF